MTYDELLVLVPCHSLEDFPTELAEPAAESLLNAFAILWHPSLLVQAGGLPRWRRADDYFEPHISLHKQLVLVPQSSEDWLGHETLDTLRQAGGTIVQGCIRREEYAEAIFAHVTIQDTLKADPDLVADFHALGLTWLLTELLTRHMRNISSVDSTRLEIETMAAAKAAIAGDRPAAEKHLRRAFETLLECRERFYPVDCWIIDVCLINPSQANDHFRTVLAEKVPFSLMASAEDLTTIAKEHADLVTPIQEGIRDQRIALIGGDWKETGGVLRSMQHTVWNMQRGRQALTDTFGSTAKVWGRRKYGVSPFIPQLASRFGMEGALHVVMDDGQYPDDEYTKFRWQGCDGTVVDAQSRIPLAGDSASAFLRFPQRLAESMDNDHAAAVIFARWPEMRTPFLNELRRTFKYSPVHGVFTTLHRFLTETEMPGRMEDYKASGYFSPLLVQSVARQQADPISRYIRDWQMRHRLESLTWCANLSALMTTGLPDTTPTSVARDLLEQADPEDAAACEQAATAIEEYAPTATDGFRDIVAPGGPGDAGWLIVNPCSFARKAVVSIPADEGWLTPGENVSQVHTDENGSTALIDLPSCGFTWVPRSAHAPASPPPLKFPSAEGLVLRNELFEVLLSDVTGGIGQIRTYKRSPNRISQQLGFRFPRERTLTSGEGENVETWKSFYTDMELKESRILSDSPALGAIETIGSLVDTLNGDVLADYSQITRVRRGRPVVEIEIELTPHRMPEGDPWSNYFGVRWAWRHETAAISRSVFQTTQVVKDEQRFEAPHFVELSDDPHRTTVITHGLPFHRKTGNRMLDTLLLVSGENRRRFRMDVVIDEVYPMQAALDAMSPPLVMRTAAQPAIPKAWLLHLGARNVILLGLNAIPTDSNGQQSRGCIARLLETEGRHRSFTMKLFQAPVSARQRDFLGHGIQQCQINGDEVTIEISPYEVCDIELKF